MGSDYSPIKDVTTHFFYSFEQVNYMLLDATSNTLVSPWNLNTTSNVHTVGTNSDWQTDDKLKLGLSYTCQFGSTAFNENAWGAAIANYTPVAQLPTNNTMLSSLSMHAEYKLLDDVTMTAAYSFERFLAKDYLSGQAATSAQYAASLLPGDGNPSYVNNVITTAIHVKF